MCTTPRQSRNSASKQYEDDGLHLELEKQQKLGILSIFVHRKCVDKYCHKKTIQRAIQEKFRKANIRYQLRLYGIVRYSIYDFIDGKGQKLELRSSRNVLTNHTKSKSCH